MRTGDGILFHLNKQSFGPLLPLGFDLLLLLWMLRNLLKVDLSEHFPLVLYGDNAFELFLVDAGLESLEFHLVKRPGN
jgi:hypothetical protein